jgi:hypothetical protein
MADPTGAEDGSDRARWHGRNWAWTAQRRFDSPDRVDLIRVVVLAIADGAGIAPDEVTDPTLFECVDIEAVSRLVESGSTTGWGSDSVRFEYDGSMIEVRADGLVSVFAPITNVG